MSDNDQEHSTTDDDRGSDAGKADHKKFADTVDKDDPHKVEKLAKAGNDEAAEASE